MANKFKIPEMYIEEIMQMFNKGETNASIARHLNKEYDLKVDSMNVIRRVKELRRIKSDAMKDSIKEAAAISGLNCVNIVDESIVILNREAVKLLASSDRKDKLAGKQLYDTCLKYVDSKMGIIGINKSDNPAGTDAE